jgi:hypothetical protein
MIKLQTNYGSHDFNARRKPPTCHKSLINIMVYTSSCSRLQLTTAVVIGTECGSFFLILQCSGYHKRVSVCIHPLSKCIWYNLTLDDLFLWWYGLLNDNGACEVLKFYWSGVSIWADKYTNMLPTHDKTSNKQLTSISMFPPQLST